MERIFGKRPWKSRADELSEESEKKKEEASKSDENVKEDSQKDKVSEPSVPQTDEKPNEKDEDVAEPKSTTPE